MGERYLNVSAVVARTEANGPGVRAAVWVQGCTLACPGCFNAHTHAHAAQLLRDPVALADDLLVDSGVAGLSLLGGEPFQQAAASADLAERAQALGKTVWVWSGYAWPVLDRATDPAVRRLLAATDVLCAGPFVSRLRVEGAAWHGSSNQQFVFLSDAEEHSVLEAAPRVEVRLDGERAHWTGQSTPEDRRFLATVLGV